MQKGPAHAKHQHVTNPQSNHLPAKPTDEKKPAYAGSDTTSTDGFHHPLPKKPRSSSTCEAIFWTHECSQWAHFSTVYKTSASLFGRGWIDANNSTFLIESMNL
jgi:hypothetical protein